MARATLTVRGRKVVSRSTRRYIVVAVRPTAFRGEDDWLYTSFVRIHKRSDNLETARTEQRKYGRHNGAFAVVVDSVTGEEV